MNQSAFGIGFVPLFTTTAYSLINPANNISSKTDEDLILQYQSEKEITIIGVLFQRYTHLVFGLCLKYLKDKEQSQDAVMDIFEKLVEDLKTHQVTNFKSWIYSVSKNHCLMQLRRTKYQHKHKEIFAKEKLGDMEMGGAMHLNGENEREIEIQRLEQAIIQLSKEQRKCIELFFLQNLSYADIAKNTQYSLKEVKSYIQNGKRNLKLILSTE